MVEQFRPGVPGFDMPMNVHNAVVPTAVFAQDSAVAADQFVHPHALQVAGVMISSDTSDTDMDGETAIGVAPMAQLYASANEGPLMAGVYTKTALAAQHVATRNNGDVRAINMSYLMSAAAADGDSLITLFVDWSAQSHDTLYVIGGETEPGGFLVPADNFNGITVGWSTQNGGVYRQVDARNFAIDIEGDRTAISLIAPGDGYEITVPGNMQNNGLMGTSFAAPHVTGTVALLQQFADQRIVASFPRWDMTRARRHEVMKAVLMNSADKLIDDGTVMVGGNPVPQGSLLGMERTVLKEDGTSTCSIPLPSMTTSAALSHSMKKWGQAT
jgi:hypothetical protein